ncbi:MAG: hypothetical protein ACK4TA_20385 [Saprospiraceae bacterium]
MSVQAIYQTYLKHLSVEERLELIQLLMDETLGTKPVESATEYDVMEFAGVGEPYALSEDAQTYVNKLRSEWE